MSCLPCGDGPVVINEDSITDVLMLGLEGSGKTLLARRLQVLFGKKATENLVANGARVAADTVPTIGTEFFEVAAWKGAPMKRVLIREVGGQMSPLWPNYFDSCCCVVFVVDASDAASLPPAAVELVELVQDERLKAKPICVVLSKLDLPGALPRAEVEMVLHLAELEKVTAGRVKVLGLSSVDVKHWAPEVEGLLRWMASKIEAATQPPPAAGGHNSKA